MRRTLTAAVIAAAAVLAPAVPSHAADGFVPPVDPQGTVIITVQPTRPVLPRQVGETITVETPCPWPRGISGACWYFF